jgi:23S rRNA (cytosine1962-C5)-methyltransferase
MQSYPAVILKEGREASLKRFHPWIFSGAIARTEGEPAPGDAVRILSSRSAELGTGFWEGGSIAVRIVSFKPRPVDRGLFSERLKEAWDLRKALGLIDSHETSAFRLVHGDGDALPGLIIDWYDGNAVMQAHSYGIYRRGEEIAAALEEVAGGRLKQLYDKSGALIGGKKIGEIRNRYLYSRTDPAAGCTVRESGHSFEVNWEEGQKTGFFLDQRENRVLLSTIAAGRRVLNAYSYSGGFSVYALAGGAEKVLSVDSSARAIELLDRNIALNGYTERHESHKGEVQPLLAERAEEFDLIILDPPAFAKHKSARHQAVQGYKRLNQAAISRIPSGGLIMTFSCSQVVGQELFEGAVRAAAIETGRNVRVLARPSQPADHPVNIFQPEGEYLKGLLLQIS